MKYVIRKVPERNTEYLEKLIPEAVVVNDVNHNGAIWSFLKAIETANDDAVYIQDDMFLCKDFKNKAEQIISENSNSVISFSTLSEKKGIDNPINEEGFYTAREGGWLLCTYIPKRVAERFKSFFMTEQYKLIGNWQHFFKGQFDDIMFCRFIDIFLKEKVYVTNPSLAGHNFKVKSSINPNRPKRISPLFDYEEREI